MKSSSGGRQDHLDKFKTIDILVNNAGITKDSMFHKMTNEQWDAVININLYGVYHMCKYVVPVMREKNYGRNREYNFDLRQGNIGQANYSATKGAIISFTKTLRWKADPRIYGQLHRPGIY